MASPVAMTNLKVLHNVPLDNTYSDTIYFASLGAQTSYFLGKVKYSYTNCTYQRVNSSVAMPRIAYSMRVPEVADKLYDCNYVMFQNTGFGSKWFYGFIRQVNYINPNNTEIIYELDDYQTWAFDIQIRPSYIEREHSISDDLYENLEPEPVEIGDYACLSFTSKIYHDFKIIIAVSTTPQNSPVPGEILDNVYSGVQFNEFSDASSANSFISSYVNEGKLDSIISIFMSPFTFGSNVEDEIEISRPTSLNGYTPRNKKLLSYPYCFIEVAEGGGNKNEYYFENFTQYDLPPITVFPAKFKIYKNRGFNPSMCIVPFSYRGNNLQNVDFSQNIQIGNFPVCGWTGNVFANWYAQNHMGLNLNLFTNLFSSVTSLFAGNLTSSVQQGVGGVGSYLSEMNSRSKNRGQLQGSAANPSIMFSADRVGFVLRTMALRPENAQRIDEFFDMFGYTTNRLKMPNLTGRESWNYVKTKDIIIDGSIPVTAMATIKAMFNRGVRFWHGDYVGNYSRSNKCIKEVNADEK